MRLALVLGSGGARGWAHIGAIQEIESRGHEVVGIAGASIGALVGGVAAAGKLDELAEWVTALTRPDVRRLYDLTFTGPGLLKGRRVLAEIEKITGPRAIEDLPLPFTAVAADLVTNREVWFQSGSLYLAVRASISMPTFFTPVLIGERLLADGGLLNPLPVEPTLALPSDATIAVNLNAAPGRSPHEILVDRIEADRGPMVERVASTAHRNVEKLTGSLADSEFFQRLERGWERLRPGSERTALPDELPEDLREEGEPTAQTVRPRDDGPVTKSADVQASPLPSGLSTMEVIDLSISSMQRIIARYRAAANPVTATVDIPRDEVGTLDFHEGAKMIELGRTKTAEVLDAAGL
ncbi:patatin-like phospholipase family protein [Nigerium massiliense]|uniref:patatin-like phospholipase family protein n=1 Tax=Nigerium massiliense TaxID=1522317 RepID=UPI00058F1316|nr:patatin-like phospholipase family protein [Nigerium massiliense]